MQRYYESKIKVGGKQGDFVHRNRHKVPRTLVFYLAYIVGIVGLYYLHSSLNLDFPFIIILTLSLCLLTLYSVFSMQTHLDMVTSIEFQNALFSCAFREGKLFSLIVSHEEEMYYSDTNFGRRYPELTKNSSRVLDTIVRESDNPVENTAKLQYALVKQQSEELDIYVDDDQQGRIKARLSIIPLQRPSGYFLVTARRFVERRSNHATHAISEREVEQMVETIITNVNEPMYVLNASGHPVTCNTAFLEMLGMQSFSNIAGTAITEYITNLPSNDPQAYSRELHANTVIYFKHQNGTALETYVTHIPVISSSKNTQIVIGKIAVEQHV